jgi:glycosyltransferase involved in cell wall biosynthesis
VVSTAGAPRGHAPVITGLDLPADAPGGSVELLYDLYACRGAPLGGRDGQVFMLPPAGGGPGRDATALTLLDVPGKSVDGPPFWRYVGALTAAMTAAAAVPEGAVVHLQHLAFGASPALIGAFPGLPRIALVHGTDLLYAERHPTQSQVLHRVLRAATRVVVPTAAMADRLGHLAPGLSPKLLVHIPWGIPDQLLAAPPPPRRRPDGNLRLLYAGRLTAEKGGRELVTACLSLPGVRLSIAAPAGQYTGLQAALGGMMSTRDPGSSRAGGPPVRWLGWLPRARLWEAFADHDLLVVPSTILEAFGLVAVEAQVCGLPVLHQPVPGLREVLAGSALPVNLADPAALAAELNWLRTDPAALTGLRAAGLANAARYPLSQTAARLASQIT